MQSAIKNNISRFIFIDNLRILLICLVITLHCSITFGGIGDWYITDPGNDAGFSLPLTMLDTIIQSFFMGMFFMIAAYFIPSSIRRKGVPVFIRDRLIRLGIPLIIWTIFINPLLTYFVYVTKTGYQGTLADFYLKMFVPFEGFHFGPMWFVFALLLFSLVAALLLRQRQDPGTREPLSFPSFRTIALVGIILGLGTFLVRIVLPIGWNWELFNFQIPFFFQYIVCFILGLYAAEHEWFSRIPERIGRQCSLAAVLLILANPLVLYLGFTTSADGQPVMGGLNWQTALYAFWEQMAAIMIIVALFWFFSVRFNSQGPVAKAAAADSYTAFIIHPLILVPVSILFFGIFMPILLKFILVLFLSILLCFAISHVIRSIPGVDRVL